MRYKDFRFYHHSVIIKNSIYKNLTRYITPWLNSRVLEICAMMIKSRNYGILINI